MTSMNEIREHYQVEETGQERMPYIITGKRGACYGLFRVTGKNGQPVMDGNLFAMKAKGGFPRLCGRNEWVRES